MSESDGSPGSPPQPDGTTLSVASGWGLVALSIALIGAGIAVFAICVPKGIDLVRLQWAGSAAVARNLVGERVSAYRNGLWSDVALIVGLPVGLVVACFLGRRVFWTSGPLRWALVGYAAAAIAGATNLVQDVLLYLPLRSGHITGVWIFRIAEAASFIKFTAFLVVAPIGLVALTTALWRLLTHRRVAATWGEVGANDIIPPPPIEVVPGWAHPAGEGATVASEQWGLGRKRELDAAIDRSWWEDRSSPPTHFTQDSQWPGGDEDAVAICLSGGGIRSATVALGALQSMRAADPSMLSKVDRIVSVSGGGYTNGALQLALTPPGGREVGPADRDAATASDVFAAGSPEEDHLRRHSSYLSDGLGQWLVALGVLLRNLLASFLVIGLTVATAGLAVGAFYRDVPMVRGAIRLLDSHPTRRIVSEPVKGLASLRTRFLAPARMLAPAYPSIPWGVRLGVGAAIAVFVLLYFAELVRWSIAGSRPATMARLSAIAGLAVAVVAIVGLGLPALVWVSSWATWHGVSSKPMVAASGATGGLSYLATLAAALWRNKKLVSAVPGDVAKGEKVVAGVLPTSMAQRIVMWLALLLLIVAALIVASWVATSGLVHSWWALVILVPLLSLAVLLDQTSMSLHPFYRRRLASAFAVRRRNGPNGIPVAAPYSYDELTRLSTYGKRRTGWPQVTFAASANLTGQSRTPPGRRTVSYTLSSDYVGGPQVGWVKTSVLEGRVSPAIARDLTVEAAVAISGAAFASAMGSQTRDYELFLALTNARLGAWLPNPRFVALKNQRREDWTVPGLPRIRGLAYFAREIFGIHSDQSRLLLCTDGGHYDNLGLVETLRHHPARIYCFDASGASDPMSDTLAGALMLAREELGVEIELDDPNQLVAGSGPPLDPAGPFSKLNPRLAIDNVITGTITYQATPTHPTPPPGRLVFAQAKLTGDLPYDVLEFTQDDPGFPNDSTADQWFDCNRFDAYKALGSVLGGKAASR